MPISKHASIAINNLRYQGVRFNITVEVDRNVELHHRFVLNTGQERVHFVAEIDHYGNVIEWGPSLTQEMVGNNPIVFNADGEEV